MKAALFIYIILITAICTWMIVKSIKDFRCRRTEIKMNTLILPISKSKISDSLRVLENFYHEQINKR
jgi:hypothetical protein